jgi:hypothetical protein
MELSLGTQRLIDVALENKAREQDSRTYLGASQLGEECSRKMWYGFHTPKPITDPRVNRIFRLGNAIEDEIVELLRMAGLTVYTEDENGNQFGFTDGKVAGHIDGVVVGLPESTKPHLFEAKSANSKKWKEFVKNGYKSNRQYWVQIQVYMYKMGLENALVVVYNKDTSELYIERIKLSKRDAELYISKGKAIADMDSEPPRQYSKSTFFKCKWCDYNEECWKGEEE